MIFNFFQVDVNQNHDIKFGDNEISTVDETNKSLKNLEISEHTVKIFQNHTKVNLTSNSRDCNDFVIFGKKSSPKFLKMMKWNATCKSAS